MNLIPCPNGRRQAAALASMNLRAVVTPIDLSYRAVPRRKPAAVRTAVAPRFQPRDGGGRFVPFAELWEAINLAYAMTAHEYDVAEEYDDAE
jgi:hypothetical protein